MTDTRNEDEHLERIWRMEEEGGGSLTLLRTHMGKDYDPLDIESLSRQGCLEVRGDEVAFTDPGRERARRLIRAHRLAELLVRDILGVPDFEAGACELEHLADTKVVDGICTLLGHPACCPHGLPIPRGDCCRAGAREVTSVVVPLTELEPGKVGRVVFLEASDEREIRLLGTSQIRPGTELRVRQRRPCYVVDTGTAAVALDEAVAATVKVLPLG
ncbi:MAG TPA: metal-dependent transcriptional regulator [Spirochaetia bacterium]|nr:metal-dependent transcriptional regulator [Spirochaetales bacterium]HRY78965.1 metal-dependent transcriptional regulator [Spirochaetia bacterium]